MNLNEHGPKVRVTPDYIVQFAAGAAKTGVHDGVALKKCANSPLMIILCCRASL
jgi:hypothetical protein